MGLRPHWSLTTMTSEEEGGDPHLRRGLLFLSLSMAWVPEKGGVVGEEKRVAEGGGAA